MCGRGGFAVGLGVHFTLYDAAQPVRLGACAAAVAPSTIATSAAHTLTAIAREVIPMCVNPFTINLPSFRRSTRDDWWLATHSSRD
jgi:hypothetical protein